MGRLAEARNAYLSVLTEKDERHLSSMVRGMDGFMAHQNLAVLATDMGDFPEAERRWREVVREIPRYRPGWQGLGDVLIRMQRLDEADQLAAELVEDVPVRVEGLLLKSRLAQVRNRLDERGRHSSRLLPSILATVRRQKAGAGFFSITGQAKRPSGAAVDDRR